MSAKYYQHKKTGETVAADLRAGVKSIPLHHSDLDVHEAWEINLDHDIDEWSEWKEECYNAALAAAGPGNVGYDCQFEEFELTEQDMQWIESKWLEEWIEL